MTSGRARAALVASAALLGACAYYNGLYNANHLAADAARAGREGRPAEARSLWEQAALKAESVAVRHPRSRYRDAALLLQGESLRDAGACVRAIEPLLLVADSGDQAGERHRAALALGECFHRQGDFGRARRALTPLVADPDMGLQRPARLWRARAFLAEGDAQSALADMEPLEGPDVQFERATALALLGRNDDAASLLARLTGPFDEPSWRAALDMLGRGRPESASRLIDQLVSRRDVGSGAQARLLLADADRWATAGEQSRSLERLRQASVVAPDSADGRLAAARLAVAALRSADSREAVATIAGALTSAVDDGGTGARVAEPALAVLRRISAARESPEADLRLFLAAEAARDALHAVPLAALLFLEVARDHPGSPIAAKALLAAAQLDTALADSLLRVVRERYAESPYWLALQGADPAAYRAVEDSLRRLVSRDAPTEPARPRPGIRPAPGDEEIRRPPTQPNRGVPEP